MIVLLVVGVNLLGDGLRDRPRRKKKGPDMSTAVPRRPNPAQTTRTPCWRSANFQVELITDAGIIRAVDGVELQHPPGRDRHHHR